MGKNTRPCVTLAALLGVLEFSEQLVLARRLGPRECEAVGYGTVEEFRAARCVEVCGDNVVERITVDVDEWPDTPAPVFLVTIGGKEARP